MARTSIGFCVLLAAMFLPALAWGGDELYRFTFSEESGTPGGSVNVRVILDDPEGGDIVGYSLAVCDGDATSIAAATDIVNGATVAAHGFTFHAASIPAGGFVVGAALAITPVQDVIPPGSDQEFYIVEYQISDTATPGETSALTHCTLGTPPNSTSIIVTEGKKAVNVDIDLVNGQVNVIEAPPKPSFLRGDCNSDADLDIADGITVLRHLFVAGAAVPGCQEACDANGDGLLNSTDGIFIFNYQFVNGPAPAAPFPDCGFSNFDDCVVSQECD